MCAVWTACAEESASARGAVVAAARSVPATTSERSAGGVVTERVAGASPVGAGLAGDIESLSGERDEQVLEARWPEFEPADADSGVDECGDDPLGRQVGARRGEHRAGGRLGGGGVGEAEATEDVGGAVGLDGLDADLRRNSGYLLVERLFYYP